MQINEHRSFVQTGELELPDHSLPLSILARSDIGTHNQTTGVFTFIGFLVGDSICRVCHPECKFGCVGVTDADCISPMGVLAETYKGCRNVQFENDQPARCLPDCPQKYFAKEAIISDMGTFRSRNRLLSGRKSGRNFGQKGRGRYFGFWDNDLGINLY